MSEAVAGPGSVHACGVMEVYTESFWMLYMSRYENEKYSLYPSEPSIIEWAGVEIVKLVRGSRKQTGGRGKDLMISASVRRTG